MDDKHNSRLLASYALFKGLFDNGKDSYGVIAEYLKKIISENGLYAFTLDDITHLLNENYEFNIPNAIVKTALKRIEGLTRAGAVYTVDNPQEFISRDFDDSERWHQKASDGIINDLISFVEETKNCKIDEAEKTILTHSFCNYILDKQNGNEYLEFISAFILKYENNKSFKEQIDRIREGVILYSGIKFNNDINDFGVWKENLVIYIETEILFHLAGFNGELYRILASDLFHFIKEINIKSGKQVVELKYFKEVKNEVEGFFTRARYLLEGNERPNPSATAMNSIINGCKTSSDIQVKKTDFYSLLRRHSIHEDDYSDYFAERNHRYNIVDQDLIDKVSKELKTDATEHLKYLNYISIHRKQSFERNFENIKAILLTGNTTTQKVAWNDLVKEKGDVPLATNLSFLTTKFWFKLNKGFGKESLPKSFDIISKSQIILSTILNKKIGDDYAELQDKFRKGKLSEDQVKARLVDLKSSVRKPEDIENDSVDDVLQVITEDSLDRFVEEQAHLKNKFDQKVQENEFLKSELIRKNDIQADLEQTRKKAKDEQQKQFESLSNIKKRLDQKAENRYRRYRIKLGSGVVLSFILIVVAIHYFDWNVIEKYTFALASTPTLFIVVYFIYTEKSIQPITAIKRHLATKKDMAFNKSYKAMDFDIKLYESLSAEHTNRFD